ncbi:MAG: prolipoprotein diacylglyceryl transferase [Lentisphaeria bacterium]
MLDPVAFHLGGLAIRWYGVCFALAFLAGYLALVLRAPRYGLTGERAGDLALTAMVGGVLGARVWYVVQNWDNTFAGAPLEIFRIDHGGLVFYGGFLMALAALAVMCRRWRLPFAAAGDLFAPALPLAHALGRLGCFLNGCCFGRPWHGACAVTYPAAGDVHAVQLRLGVPGVTDAGPLPVFPIQLVEAGANVALAAALLLIERRTSRRGLLFPVYLACYALIRFAGEFARGDYLSRPGGLTSAQWLCLLLFPAALAWGVVAWRRAGGLRDAGK